MDDLISRQAAIDAECEVCQIAPKKERGHNCTYYVHGCKEIECLRALPSAQPVAKDINVPVNDTISRQATIELIERMKPYHQDADDIAEMLANMPPAQQEQRWIPCSDDDVPKEYGSYLITEMPIGDFEIEPYVATYFPEDDEWTTGHPYRTVRRPVIAWMPLPKSYSERRQDE